jgi:lysozyme
MRRIPQVAIDFIKDAEACVLKVYADTGSVPTSGYGHTASELRLGDPISQAQADQDLGSDLVTAAMRLCDVTSADTVTALTDNQYAALLSFVFNLGADPSWTIWKRLKAKQFDQVPLEMMKFVNGKVNGVTQKIQGLVNRRAAEVALWATEEPGISVVEQSSSVTRVGITPPTPSDPVSAGKSKALVVGAVGAVAGAGPMVNQVVQAIQPYANQSDYVQKMLGILATVAAACAAIGLIYMWIQKRNARN